MSLIERLRSNSLSWRNQPADIKQMNYAHDLADELGEVDKYQWILSKWTKGELSDLIDKLKRRLGYD